MEKNHSMTIAQSGEVIPTPIHTQQVEELKVNVYADRLAMGTVAAKAAGAKIKELQGMQERVRIIFAAAPSQNELLAQLTLEPGIDWQRVTAFHMDEYIGLTEEAPQKFSRFLVERLFDKVKPGELHLIQSSDTAQAECERYAGLLAEAPIDIVCLGIGENCHIAFNDPPVADFNDPEWVKTVELELACRQQQVNDGCFTELEEVPTHAITLTIPALLSASHLYCVVPGLTKSAAVAHTLLSPVSTEYPSTILRKHNDCTLYLEPNSFSEATQNKEV